MHFLCKAPRLRGGALHKKSWALIERPYSLGCATVGALYERPRCIFFVQSREEGNAGFRSRSMLRTAARNGGVSISISTRLSEVFFMCRNLFFLFTAFICFLYAPGIADCNACEPLAQLPSAYDKL